MPSRTLRIPNPVAEVPAAVPAALLEGAADRFRPGGTFVLLLRGDGSVGWHDPSAPPFFLRYVLPLLQHPDPAATRAPVNPAHGNYGEAGNGYGGTAHSGNGHSGNGHSGNGHSGNGHSGNGHSGNGHNSNGAPGSPYGAAVWHSLPGVALAGFPFYEKKQRLGVVVLAARAASFELGEDVLRACGRFGLDAGWLAHQANELPAYGDEAILRHAKLLAATLRDHARAASLEAELTTLSEQLANTYEELSLIYQISSGMKVNRRAGEFFKQACLDVLDVMNVRGMGVALHGDLHDRPEPVLYGPLSLPPAKVQQLSDALMAVLRERKSPLLIDDLPADPNFGWVGPYARQLLAVPLQRQEQVLGCLIAVDKVGGDFDSVDTKLLNSIANESAIYLENAMLFEDVHGLMMGLLHSLTSAVDAKDAYTCGHSERVALISRHLAQEVGLSDHDVEQVYMAGLLHDVGKIGVPESVLQKTGRLTAEEFEQMKKHPQIGARILADVKQLKPILPGVLHHHERFDGKGYPSGLAGKDIPLMGRIICLADCFDAMTSNRTYRKALPLQVAMSEIRRCSGTQFDPLLAEAFLRTSPEGLRELLRDHQEKSKRLLELQETLRSTK